MHLVINGSSVCNEKGGGVPPSMHRDVDCVPCMSDTMYELARAHEFAKRHNTVKPITSLTVDEAFNLLDSWNHHRNATVEDLPPLR